MEEQFVSIQKNQFREGLRLQNCSQCSSKMGDMPGSRDAYCPNCGYKDPCCE